MHTTSFLAGDSFFSSEFSKSFLPEHSKFDFLSFLEVIQVHEVDILATTWQQALDSLGIGATAEVRQSLVNLQTSFAFKRPMNRHSSFDPEALFAWLIREVTILRHPVARAHKNLLSLEGVCWDYSVSEELLRPVLIFNRAQHGDLSKFVQKDKFRELSISSRVELATDIMSAVDALHRADIIHGDLKPQNVLIFENVDTTLSARVADFGYSSLIVSNSGSIALPISRPWNAPEVLRRDRQWTIAEAKSADIYSLGLLCLWILFRDQITRFSGLVVDDVFFSDDGAALLHEWKEHNRVSEVASAITQSDSSLAQGMRDVLENFFKQAFSAEETRSRLDLQHTIAQLRGWKQETKVENTSLEKADLNHDLSTLHSSQHNFHLQPHFLQLLSSHYRIRNYIVKCLHDRATITTQTNTVQNAAFQLAVCYKIGFGCERSDAIAQTWLKLSSFSAKDLSQYIQNLNTERNLHYHNDEIARLVKSGSFQRLEYALEYRRAGSLAEVEKVYSREISNFQEVFGPQSSAVLSLQMILGHIMIDQSRFPEAESIMSEALKGYMESFGKDGQETLICMSELGRALEENDKLSEARSVQSETLERRKLALGSNHLDTLESLRRLAGLLQTVGDYSAAESLARQDLQSRRLVRGENHPDVFESMATLASILQDMGNYEESVTWNEKALEGLRSVLGDEHPQTMVSIGNLASILQELGRYDEAEKLFREDLEISRRILGDDHVDTISSLSNLGLVLFDMERYQEAEKVTREALAAGARIQGEDHSATLISRANLALLLERLEQFEEAEQMWHEVLKTREALLDSDHPHMASAMSNLAENLVQQDRLEEALALHNKAVTIRLEKLGDDHPETLESGAALAHILTLQNRLPEAESYLRIVLDGRIDKLGFSNPQTLTAFNALVDVLEQQGKVGEAKDVVDEFVAAAAEDEMSEDEDEDDDTGDTTDEEMEEDSDSA